jgi:hypothetical protein
MCMLYGMDKSTPYKNKNTNLNNLIVNKSKCNII